MTFRRSILAVVSLLAFTPDVAFPAKAPPMRAHAGPARFPFGRALTRTPLAPPLVVTGGFGEYRVGHFHAGLDLGTGGRVGKPVRAPENGWVERVRCSGVGYGRSLYIRAADGRTFQLGHLDAFAPAIDAYVRKAQEASGQYEQDLWPDKDQLRVRAGRVVAWSGQSGAGGPHLHFEIRRGDVAYHPARAGLVVRDRKPPTIPRVTLEPLDDSSSVNGSMGPVTLPLGGRADTARAIGRLRAVVDARDGSWKGVDRMVPWSVAITWRDRTTECRFDSVSWATDMPEGDYVHDAGRVTGGKGLVLWAPAGWRPRFLRSDAPRSEEAGTVDVRPGDPPRTLVIVARDLGGHTTRRTVVLRSSELPPRPQPGWSKVDVLWLDLPGELVSLPGGFVRWSLPARLAPEGVDLQVGSSARRATRLGDRWCVTLPNPAIRPSVAAPVPFAARFIGSGAPPNAAGTVIGGSVRSDDSLELADGERRILLPRAAVFEESFVFADRGRDPSHAPGMIPATAAWNLHPATLPLRRPARVILPVSAGAPGLDRVGLCRLGPGGWQWVGGARDSMRNVVAAETRQLGTFALFRDVTPPVAVLERPPRSRVTRPYGRWSLEAAVRDEGSGIDARASWLEVDGKRVPTEWDPEAGRLRWRPAQPPPSGAHQVLVVAADRAGNTVRVPASF